MKSLLLVMLVGGIAIVVGSSMYLTRQHPARASTTDELAEARPIGERRQSVTPEWERGEEPSGAVVASEDQRTHAATPIPAATDIASHPAAAPPPTLFDQAIETLVSPQASFRQKHEAWKQVQDAGQLDQVIEALKKGATGNPTSAAYPASLGQAQLYRAGELSRNGGTINEMGILGMQADQNFDTALKLDPANWEAQFFKAAAMSHWPLELNKGEEVIERLSRLIDQQDTVSPQPQFAQTYVVLGDQYQKMGNPDYAAATWQIGAQKFPGDPALQQKNRGN